MFFPDSFGDHVEPLTEFYSLEELATLDKQTLPRHIAIIPDGNRRWAQLQKEITQEGHTQGTQAVIQIVKAAKMLGIQVITLYTFSTENWLRPQEDVDFLMALLESNLRNAEPWMIQNGARAGFIGDVSKLPGKVREQIETTKSRTASGEGIQLVFAVNYGSWDEMRRLVLRISRDLREGGLKEEQVDEACLARYLDTAPWGHPHLLIRTSGEKRLSNFLLLQSAYSEFYFTDVLWPDFTPKHLLQALLEYQRRDKRRGI